jgi:hypothetical protein
MWAQYGHPMLAFHPHLNTQEWFCIIIPNTYEMEFSCQLTWLQCLQHSRYMDDIQYLHVLCIHLLQTDSPLSLLSFFTTHSSVKLYTCPIYTVSLAKNISSTGQWLAILPSIVTSATRTVSRTQ